MSAPAARSKGTALPALKESDITTQIKGFLESRGWYAIRLQSGTVRGVTGGTFMRLGKRGLPDWCFLRGREALMVEMKRPGGKLSADQQKWFTWAEIQGIMALHADGLGAFMAKYGRLYTR